MTENQIEKAVELAEGFELKVNRKNTKYINYKSWFIFEFQDTTEWEYYPLLLYRAMEGFNLRNIKNEYKYINLDSDIINYSSGINSNWEKGDDGSSNIWYFNYTSTPYLTAQEQALEAALEEVL